MSDRLQSSPLDRVRLAYQHAHAAAQDAEEEAHRVMYDLLDREGGFHDASTALKRWTEASAKATAARRARDDAETALAGAAITEMFTREMRAKERAHR